MIFKSGNDAAPDNHRYKLCKFLVMDGCIYPAAQRVDKFLGKTCKVYYRYFYYSYIITDPNNYKLHPMPSSSQLCAI